MTGSEEQSRRPREKTVTTLKEGREREISKTKGARPGGRLSVIKAGRGVWPGCVGGQKPGRQKSSAAVQERGHRWASELRNLAQAASLIVAGIGSAGWPGTQGAPLAGSRPCQGPFQPTCLLFARRPWERSALHQGWTARIRRVSHSLSFSARLLAWSSFLRPGTCWGRLCARTDPPRLGLS